MVFSCIGTFPVDIPGICMYVCICSTAYDLIHRSCSETAGLCVLGEVTSFVFSSDFATLTCLNCFGRAVVR